MRVDAVRDVAVATACLDQVGWVYVDRLPGGSCSRPANGPYPRRRRFIVGEA